MPVIRQTQKYLRELFGREGVSPRRALGQNFLIDLNIHELIATSAELGLGDLVLEVGTGAGALTSLLAERAGAVVAVEFDPAMARLTTRAVELWPSVRVINADALAGKNRLNPVLVDQVKSGLAAVPGRRLKLVANLPYNIATPLVSNLIVHHELRADLMVVTIQRELADRMVAKPRTPEYGSLSVILGALAEVELVRILPPSVFWPRPKVESAVVRIRTDEAKRTRVGDVEHFQAVVRGIFLHRRKNLRSAMSLLASTEGWEKTDADRLLVELGIDPRARAETLSVEQFIAIAKKTPKIEKSE